MLSKQRECYFSPLIQDENGDLTNASSDIVKEGYFEFWGPSSILIWVGDVVNPTPIALNKVIGIFQEKSTGKVFLANPETVTFKIPNG